MKLVLSALAISALTTGAAMAGNVGLLDQVGLGNMGITVQGGDYNYSTTNQIGAGNFSFTIQDGFLNGSSTLQVGAGNTAITDQWGVGNQSATAQFGNNGHYSETNQAGHGNVGVTVQTDAWTPAHP